MESHIVRILLFLPRHDQLLRPFKLFVDSFSPRGATIEYYERLLREIDVYLPQLYAMKRLEEGEHLATYEWRSMFTESCSDVKTVRGELCFALILKANILANLASAIAQKIFSDKTGNFLSDLPKAATNLREGAGILSHLMQEELGDLQVQNVPELSLEFAEALENIFLGSAQQLTICKALSDQPSAANKLSLSLLMKLHRGAYDYFNKAERLLRDKFRGSQSNTESFLGYTTFYARFHLASIIILQAKEVYAKGEFGNGLRLLAEASTALKDRMSVGGPGLPSLSGRFCEALGSELGEIRSSLDTLINSWNDDNNKIYFMPVPKEVPVTFEDVLSKQIVRSILFTPPEVNVSRDIVQKRILNVEVGEEETSKETERDERSSTEHEFCPVVPLEVDVQGSNTLPPTPLSETQRDDVSKKEDEAIRPFETEIKSPTRELKEPSLASGITVKRLEDKGKVVCCTLSYVPSKKVLVLKQSNLLGAFKTKKIAVKDIRGLEVNSQEKAEHPILSVKLVNSKCMRLQFDSQQTYSACTQAIESLRAKST